MKKGHNWKHQLTTKQYYDTYIKSSKDGICKICSKSTVWHRQKFCYDDYCEEHKPKKIYSTYNNRKQAIQTSKDRFDGKLNSGAWSTRNKKLDQFEKR